MGTRVRPEISGKNPYYLTRHRFYELRHFCLQYPEWKRLYFNGFGLRSPKIPREGNSSKQNDFTGEDAVFLTEIGEKMKIVEQTAVATDPELVNYILLAVTEGLSYTELSVYRGIPCSKNTFYDRYRKFFWLLDKRKNV